ncbi:hypothetical protein, partial [Streptomyces sp. NPDC006147]|uniref:hypothetical protein n=1 Tax=Streptomyces sp. NPDC006147 TaxID=3155597 RepID=UPI0033BEF078
MRHTEHPGLLRRGSLGAALLALAALVTLPSAQSPAAAAGAPLPQTRAAAGALVVVGGAGQPRGHTGGAHP